MFLLFELLKCINFIYFFLDIFIQDVVEPVLVVVVPPEVDQDLESVNVMNVRLEAVEVAVEEMMVVEEVVAEELIIVVVVEIVVVKVVVEDLQGKDLVTAKEDISIFTFFLNKILTLRSFHIVIFF